MNYALLIELWEEDEQYFYFKARKVLKEEVDKLMRLQDLFQQLAAAFGNNRVFLIRVDKETQERVGYYVTEAATQDARPLTQEETDALQGYNEFELKRVFYPPAGHHEGIKKAFEGTIELVNNYTKMIELLKKVFDNAFEKIEDFPANKDAIYQATKAEVKKELLRQGLQAGYAERLLFDIDEHYLFNPP